MDCRLLACDGEADHLHLLVEYPPKIPVSVLVNMFKGTSSRMLRVERPDIAQRYWRKGILWSPSYFAASNRRGDARDGQTVCGEPTCLLLAVNGTVSGAGIFR